MQSVRKAFSTYTSTKSEPRIASTIRCEFEKHYPEIYPSELELKKENVVNTETNFLELNIRLSERLFHTKLYDKRDEFGFHISWLPFKDSNIPHRMFYSSASAEILRICRATSNLQDVVVSSKALVNNCCVRTLWKNVLLKA